MMKKLLLAALAVGLLTACSKDEEGAKTSQLVGKWQNIKAEYYQGGNLVNSMNIKEANDDCPSYLEFKAGETYQQVSRDANCAEKVNVAANYKFDGSTLNLIGTGFNSSYKIVKLTDTEFVYESTDSQTEKTMGYYKKLN